MKLLAIETSTEACSVALWIDDQCRERFEIAPRRHTELVLPWADALLADAGIAKSSLDAIAVGRGPGAFTGVRLAVALAQGLALALDKPVVAVSTLAALALQASVFTEASGDNSGVMAAIDARMGELYLGLFERDAEQLLRPLRDEWMARPDAVEKPAGKHWYGVGSGFDATEGTLRAVMAESLLQCDGKALPHAADIARLAVLAWHRGEAIAPELLAPAYLRDKVALTLAEQGRAVR